MKKRIYCYTCAAALIATAAFADPVIAPVRLPDPGADQRPLPKIPPQNIPPQTCQVDPAIVELILTKVGERNLLTIQVKVSNLGRSAWASGDRQQSVRVVARNSKTGRVSSHRQALPGSAGANSAMTAFTTPVITDIFDGGGAYYNTVDAEIGYEPDIIIDGNDCNDDSNKTNNRRTIGVKQVSAFIQSAASTQSF
jgi:hypothetical protein